jgi:hypothetical protein
MACLGKERKEREWMAKEGQKRMLLLRSSSTQHATCTILRSIIFWANKWFLMGKDKTCIFMWSYLVVFSLPLLLHFFLLLVVMGFWTQSFTVA